MRVLRATRDLLVEVWTGGSVGRPPARARVRIRRGLAGGEVTVWPEEMDALLAALLEASAAVERSGRSR